MAASWGMTVPLARVPLAEHADFVRELTDLGYAELWSAETAGTDAFTPLSLAALWSPTVRLGTAIAPVYTRGAGTLAMQAATVAELAPGRFTLGIGTSSDVIVERWNGLAFDKPYQRVRDTLRFLRAALAGEKVTESYETFSIKGFRLERPPAQPPRIVLAALRAGMLKLAGREADGAITNWLAATDVPTVRGALGDDAQLVARLFVCPTDDVELARNVGRMAIAAYLTVPVYAAFHEWLGRGEVLAPMQQAWAARDRAGAVKAIPDEVVDALVVHGPPDEIWAKLRAYADNGVDVPVLGLLPTGTGDPREQVRWLGSPR